MLQLKNTPGFARHNLVMTHPHHQQVGQHRDANGLLTAVCVPTDLVLAQPQTRFQLPVHELHLPDIMPPMVEAFTRVPVNSLQIILPRPPSSGHSPPGEPLIREEASTDSVSQLLPLAQGLPASLAIMCAAPQRGVWAWSGLGDNAVRATCAGTCA